MVASRVAPPVLRRVYWETTAACNLRCIHCRRTDLLDRVAPDQLSTEQAFAMIDDLAAMGKPVLILSGGEPLYRRDIFEIASYAAGKGLPVALSTNGTLVSDEMAAKIKKFGIYYASVSLDGARAETHDIFRGPGSFDRATAAIGRLRAQGIKVQINFTVTKQNVAELPEMCSLAETLGAQALYLFLLVPVGCGVHIAQSQMLDSAEVETWLRWVREKSQTYPLELRPICAPQYYRVAEEMDAAESARGGDEKKSSARRLGCLAGINICFITHKGEIYPCGYLPVGVGNVKDQKVSDIWAGSEAFVQLRDFDQLAGKCGACSYKTVCGGCRARGYFEQGSILAEEPFCLHDPSKSENAILAP